MTAAAPLQREHLDSSFVPDFSTKNMDCKFFLHLMQGEADKSRSRPISFSVKMGEDKKAIACKQILVYNLRIFDVELA